MLVNRRKKPFDISTMPTCKTFFDITGIAYVGNDMFAKNLSVWNLSGFTNRQKMFLFKFYNNILGLNVRTSHFLSRTVRECVSSVRKIRYRNRTMKLSCIYSTPVKQQKIGRQNSSRNVYQRFRYWRNRKKIALVPRPYTSDLYCKTVFLSILTFQYCVWKAKLKKKIPSFNSIFTQFIDLIKQTANFNSEFRNDI